ncbi:hypothetical protein M2451_001318 [Dysgonomonas sp. PFB1-18]|uniref:hypothetical protein n=1 Tax=unclassified Dysgonomonas TaxID=2630389 RepID=UPI00247509BA|nr:MULTISPECIES: hypothetical protein [unclassified Dysgonomonas]MDH6308752.1 hypothetical protein [Dysgonomonas sp. PF1-14]MDH6338551.1 hypothetical protein [Dysgonomonas sp. PF1-16]MDH6380001.1 hypothetical protein [Dysgonomonas sp. PFB1-18]MDH6397379.1 hypothetical protein [Dysgonomonas sp. PF1-23]
MKTLRRYIGLLSMAMIILLSSSCSNDDNDNDREVILPQKITMYSYGYNSYNRDILTEYTFSFDNKNRVKSIIKEESGMGMHNKAKTELMFSYDDNTVTTYKFTSIIYAPDEEKPEYIEVSRIEKNERFTYKNNAVDYIAHTYNMEVAIHLSLNTKNQIEERMIAYNAYTENWIYEHDKKGNMVKGQSGFSGNTYISEYDSKIGIYKDVNNPSWFIMEFLPLGLNINNNLLKTTGEDVEDPYEIIYNANDYPISIENISYKAIIEYSK